MIAWVNRKVKLQELQSESYCKAMLIEIDYFNFDSYYVWITFPNGITQEFSVDTTEKDWVNSYWKSCVYAAETWKYILMEENKVPEPPVFVLEVPLFVPELPISVPEVPVFIPEPPPLP